jgi:CheY-like chemotaxis protein
MNGKEAANEIRKIKPEIKIIFSSGYAPENLQEKVSLEDDIDFVSKPVSPAELLKKVRSVLDRE